MSVSLEDLLNRLMKEGKLKRQSTNINYLNNLLASAKRNFEAAAFEKAVLPEIPSMHIDLMVPYNAPYPKDVIARSYLRQGDNKK